MAQRWLAAALCGAFILSALAGPLAGPLAAAEATAAERAPLERLAAGDYGGARAALRVLIAGRPDAALHAAMLEAMILVRQGQRAEAAALLRQILAAEPRFEPARRELAALLAADGQAAGALYHARTLMATTQDARLRAELQGFIAAQEAGRARGITTRFAILPSSNANGGTDARSVSVGGLPFVPDPGSRATAAIGLALGATAWNRWQLGERSDATLSASIDTRQYDKAAVADETTVGLRLDFGLVRPRARLRFGPNADVTWKEGERYRERIGLAVSGDYRLRPDLQLGGNLAVWSQDHPGRGFLDGTRVAGSLDARHVVGPDLALSLSLPFTIETAKAAHLEHRDIGLTLAAEKAWPGGLISGASIGRTWNRYEGDFPAFGTPRRDIVTTASLSLRHRDLRLRSFVPELTLTWGRSRSNIPFFDYIRRDIGLAFTQRF